MIKGFITGLAFITMFGCACKYETTYKREAKVIDIDKEVVTVIDKTGNLWEFKGDGFKLNDEIVLVMDINNTDMDITDDIIKDVQ